MELISIVDITLICCFDNGSGDNLHVAFSKEL